VTTVPVAQVNAERDQTPGNRHCGAPRPCPVFQPRGSGYAPGATAPGKCPCGVEAAGPDVEQWRVAELVEGGMSVRDACLAVYAPSQGGEA